MTVAVLFLRENFKLMTEEQKDLYYRFEQYQLLRTFATIYPNIGEDVKSELTGQTSMALFSDDKSPHAWGAWFLNHPALPTSDYVWIVSMKKHYGDFSVFFIPNENVIYKSCVHPGFNTDVEYEECEELRPLVKEISEKDMHIFVFVGPFVERFLAEYGHRSKYLAENKLRLVE